MSSTKNKPVHVVMLAASLPPLPAGGAEIQALRLGEALTKQGIKVSYITAGTRAVRGEAEINGMPVYRIHSILNTLFSFLSGLKKSSAKPVETKIEYDDKTEVTNKVSRPVGWPTVVYYNIFYLHSFLYLWKRRHSFDIIHAHTMEWSAIVATRLGKRLKKPVVIKDSTMNGFASLQRFPSGKQLQQMVAGYANFIAMTKVIEENMIKEGIPAASITRIPNGIAIAPGVGSRSVENLNVLFVGNLYQQPAKGVDILLKAWVIVARQFPNAKLQIVGDGVTPAYHQFVKKLQIENSVVFEGKQSNLPAYYKAAAVFVLPSRREGMSNALMEAMMWGLPTVATDISGNQDLITDKVNGLLVPPADIDALANALCYMLVHESEANAMGEAAKETIIKQVEIGVVAAKYIDLYRGLVQ